jgi:aryl-alcohol dehydrogenase-like predicted oxidoreductase
VDTIRTYLDAGGNHIDTAFDYHKSEKIVGEAIRGYDRDKLVLVSKTYAGCDNVSQIPEIRKNLEISLRDLGTEYVDVYMIHGSPNDRDHMNHLADAFEELKEEGKIRAVGASIRGPVNDDESLETARLYAGSGRIEVIQLAYSVVRQKHAEMFALAAEKGVGLIARWVIEAGMLSGKYPPGHEFIWPDIRNRYRPEERDAHLQAGQDLKGMLPEGYSNPIELATKFVLASPEVSGVILGGLRPDQVKRNCAMDKLPDLAPELVAELRARYAPYNDRYNPTGEFEHVPSPRE